jgi:Spy/CpxP family protein refolding chaperone
MKAMMIAAALAFGATAVATVPGNAASVGVTVTTRDDGHWDNGRHYGWWRGRHLGWRNRDCEVRRRVIWRDGERIVRTVRECRR